MKLLHQKCTIKLVNMTEFNSYSYFNLLKLDSMFAFFFFLLYGKDKLGHSA